jgi:hypothetical protein
MLSQPRFKPHYRVHVVPGEGAFVLSQSRQALLRGRLYELVAPQVDGRPIEDICERLCQQISAAEVYLVLGQLEKKGYLCEDEASLPSSEAAWWSGQQIDPAAAARRLAETPVRLCAFGIEASPLADLLRQTRRIAGIQRRGAEERNTVAAGSAAGPAHLDWSVVPSRHHGLLGMPGPADARQSPG